MVEKKSEQLFMSISHWAEKSIFKHCFGVTFLLINFQSIRKLHEMIREHMFWPQHSNKRYKSDISAIVRQKKNRKTFYWYWKRGYFVCCDVWIILARTLWLWLVHSKIFTIFVCCLCVYMWETEKRRWNGCGSNRSNMCMEFSGVLTSILLSIIFNNFVLYVSSMDTLPQNCIDDQRRKG